MKTYQIILKDPQVNLKLRPSKSGESVLLNKYNAEHLVEFDDVVFNSPKFQSLITKKIINVQEVKTDENKVEPITKKRRGRRKKTTTIDDQAGESSTTSDEEQ